jgi:hypothetical protein
MRLPSRTVLANLPIQDAHGLLSSHERDCHELLNAGIFDHRGDAYHRARVRRKVRRIENIRAELGLT